MLAAQTKTSGLFDPLEAERRIEGQRRSVRRRRLDSNPVDVILTRAAKNLRDHEPAVSLAAMSGRHIQTDQADSRAAVSAAEPAHVPCLRVAK